MISVLVSAYQAQNYLSDLINSANRGITACKNRYGIRVELLIVSDSCEETLKVATSLKKKFPFVRVFKNYENVGYYINVNSLAEFAKYDHLMIFGADDHFTQRTFVAIAEQLGKDKLVRFWYTHYDDLSLEVPNLHSGKPFGDPSTLYSQGVFAIDKSFFFKMGGFMPWRVAADTEFLYRCEENGAINVEIFEALFWRRLHETSVTKQKDTGSGSKLRNDAIRYIVENEGNRKPIELQTVELIEI